ncbi:MAG: type II toxin-antitoxin system VapC family toxin [Bryobacteraceae bacterium]|nr:type II toxin-antitoxin system VapC family toxin [Bryobacteraceae bacterium]
MIPPEEGPFLFDTSAESWLSRSTEPASVVWIRQYLRLHPIHVSSITILERSRGYAMLWRAADRGRREAIEAARIAYLEAPRRVHAVDSAIALIAAELMALLPEAPSPVKRAHRVAESRAEPLARWRFDILIASTALVTGLTLLHQNAADFEAIRSAVENQPERFPQVGPLQLARCASIGR